MFLLAKPLSRRTVVFTKVAVAAACSATLTCGPILLGGLIAAGGLGEGLVIGMTVAAAIGLLLYCAVFVTLSLVTSRALVFDRGGNLRATYEKLHLPEEPGFWETSHYQPGTEAPHRIDGFGMPIGVQICSDANRPEGTHLLAAQGVEAVLIPRATESATYQRWRLVFRANALTSACYVLSVNRPDTEAGVLIGGPSIAVDPNAQVLLETNDPIGIVTLESAVIARARVAYPGYLPVRADLYADAWADIAGDRPATR